MKNRAWYEKKINTLESIPESDRTPNDWSDLSWYLSQMGVHIIKGRSRKLDWGKRAQSSLDRVKNKNNIHWIMHSFYSMFIAVHTTDNTEAIDIYHTALLNLSNIKGVNQRVIRQAIKMKSEILLNLADTYKMEKMKQEAIFTYFDALDCFVKMNSADVDYNKLIRLFEYLTPLFKKNTLELKICHFINDLLLKNKWDLNYELLDIYKHVCKNIRTPAFELFLNIMHLIQLTIQRKDFPNDIMKTWLAIDKNQQQFNHMLNHLCDLKKRQNKFLPLQKEVTEFRQLMNDFLQIQPSSINNPNHLFSHSMQTAQTEEESKQLKPRFGGVTQ